MGRDAFGREQDDDPIAEMGWHHAPGSHQGKWAQAPDIVTGPDLSTASQTAEHSEILGDVSITADDGVTRFTHGNITVRGLPRRRGGGRWGVRLAVLAVVGFFVVPFAVGIVKGISDAVEEFELPSSPGGSSATPLPEAEADAEGDAADEEDPAAEEATPKATTVINSSEVRRAIREMRRLSPGTRPALVRIDRDKLDVQVRGGGKIAGLRMAAGEPATKLYENRSSGGPTTFAWSQIDPRAPSRVAAKAPDLDYAVLLRSPDLRWTVFAKGKLMTARPDGRGVQRVGGR